MRKLAHVEKIVDIRPIPNADSIEVATVLGWDVVVKKGEFSVGDSVVYVEIDSILPARPEFDFMKDRKYKVKTIKLRGQISQGIVFPLSIMPDSWTFSGNMVGQDVTDVLGITKNDPQVLEENKTSGDVRRFPDWIRKTDEERIQNLPFVLENNYTFYSATEKLDGQSATYFATRKKRFLFGFIPFGFDYEFGVCSRNLRLFANNNSNYWKIAESKNIKKHIFAFLDYFKSESVVVQGEIIGSGVQGNKYSINGLDFYMFNLIVNGKALDIHRQNPFYGKWNVVPSLGNIKVHPDMGENLRMAEGKSLVNPKVEREGMVLRDYERQLSFKIISNKFLLKNND